MFGSRITEAQVNTLAVLLDAHAPDLFQVDTLETEWLTWRNLTNVRLYAFEWYGCWGFVRREHSDSSESVEVYYVSSSRPVGKMVGRLTCSKWYVKDIAAWRQP